MRKLMLILITAVMTTVVTAVNVQAQDTEFSQCKESYEECATAQYHFDQGIEYGHKKDYASALVHFDKAIEYRPNMMAAYMNRANMTVWLGRELSSQVSEWATCGYSTTVRNWMLKAYTDYSKVIYFNPTYPSARNSRAAVMYEIAVSYFDCGDVDKMNEWFDMASRDEEAVEALQEKYPDADSRYELVAEVSYLSLLADDFKFVMKRWADKLMFWT